MLFSVLLASAVGLAAASPVHSRAKTCGVITKAKVDPGNCACGYRDDQNNLWRESMISDFAGDYAGAMQNFAPMSWGVQDKSFYKQNELENLIPTTEGLDFKVKAYDGSGTIFTSEIESKRSDLFYGTFRFLAKNTDVPGTCLGLFTYTHDAQETDIEFISGDPAGKIWYTNQPSTDSHPDVVVDGAVADFSSKFYEHRFDWLPEETNFFVNSKQQGQLTKEVQNKPTKLMLNHWSNGDAMWSQGPPLADAVATVRNVHAYFNSTTLTEDQFTSQCASAQVAECLIDMK